MAKGRSTARNLTNGCAFFLLLALVPAALGAEQKTDAADLYRRVATVPLDPQQVFTIRDASIEREDLHLSFDDGTIAFTKAVDGHITGAMFVGEGQVLLVPPNQTERQSLALFTGAAVLSEQFTVAYLRFSDDKMAEELRAATRPPEDAAGFLEKYGAVATNLAERDALRCLVALTHSPQPAEFLRARVSGKRLGTFDILYDTSLSEQISVAQIAYADQGIFYDLWTSFPARSIRQRQGGEKQRNNESNFQSEGNAGTEEGVGSIVITDYEIDARVQPPSSLSATATLELRANSGGERVVLFELSHNLKVSSVTVDGAAAEFLQNPAIQGGQVARRGNDLVAVVFPGPMVTGAKAKLTFTYAGAVLSDAGGGLMYVGARGMWYPNRGISMADYKMTFRHPAAYKLIATGKRVSSEKQGSEETSRWISEKAIPIAGFNVGKYDSVSAQAGNVLVESYAARATESALQPNPAPPRPPIFSRRSPLPEALPPVAFRPDPARNLKKVAQQSAATIEFLASRIGPFPYSSLSLTQMPGPESQGWPGLVFLSSLAYLDASQRGRAGHDEVNDIFYDSVMQAHETAHQWWGDSVLWRSYRDQWLMESLSNYCALMQLETQHPEQFKKVMEGYRQDLLHQIHGSELRVKDAGAVTLGVRLNSSKLRAYDTVAYGRGTWLIHMLRHMLRDTSGKTKGADPDALFFSVLRKIQERSSGKAISMHDFQAELEAVLPKELWYEDSRSLDWFTEQWVNGFEIPQYELREVRYSQTGRRRSASATLLQKDAPDSLVTSVPVYAQTDSGAPVYVGRVFADGAESQFKVSVPPGTKKLLLDPLGTVLTRPR